MLEIFDKRFAAVPNNAIVIDKKIKRLEKVLKSIRQEISRKTKSGSGVIQSLYNNIYISGLPLLVTKAGACSFSSTG